jgi:hypothetical protein
MSSLKLDDDDLRDAAQAARLASVQAERDAAQQTNPGVRATFDGTARRFRELAARFEQARQRQR